MWSRLAIKIMRLNNVTGVYLKTFHVYSFCDAYSIVGPEITIYFILPSGKLKLSFGDLNLH